MMRALDGDMNRQQRVIPGLGRGNRKAVDCPVRPDSDELHRTSVVEFGKIYRLFLTAAAVLLVILFSASQPAAAEKSDLQFKKQPEIQQIRPQKPVKVKLHRNAKGEYSWELSGDNVDEIVNQDRKLRKLLKIQ